MHKLLSRRLRTSAALLLLALTTNAVAQINISGLTSQSVYTDSVTFTITVDAGYDSSAHLDGAPVPLGQPVAVTTPDYHELLVLATNQLSGGTLQSLTQFIVRASERGNSEWGLPPWTPYPTIPSAPPELAAAQLDLILPTVYPASLELPVVAQLRQPDGRPVRANGTLLGSHGPPILLRRGIGSGFLPATNTAGSLTYEAQLQDLTTSKTILIEPEPTWTPVSGNLTGTLEWPNNARMAVTGSLTLTAGSSLLIQPGTIVRLEAGVDFLIDGHLTIAGTTENPVIFTPTRRTQPWGGFILRNASARIAGTGAIFIGSGANPDWFDENPGYDVHRSEQALFLLDEAELTLTNSYAFDHAGQFGHGRNAHMILDHCLVQKFITAGEYSGGAVSIYDSALIEFPEDSAVFADGDNDGIYFTTGTHEIQDTLIGWLKDDGIDHGSGGAGTLRVSNCWVEACFHEAYAWSGGGRVITMTDDIALNCGQGIEAGWSNGSDSPRVYADHCLSLGNLSGARFGDNYDWSYNGLLQVTNSLLLYNYRDVFGYAWSDWAYHASQIDLHDNWLTTPNPRHPENRVWDPLADATQLAPFMTTPPDAAVGIGIALYSSQFPLERLTAGVPVGLSSFTTHPVTVTYTVDIPSQNLSRGTLEFLPGETVKRINVELPPAPNPQVLRLHLTDAQGGQVTGLDTVWFLGDSVGSPDLTLVPAGSRWLYLDDGSNQGTAWTAIDFDPIDWSEGSAELGYGDANDGRPETTVISYGTSSSAKHITYYFRHSFAVENPNELSELTVHLKRDDGAVVHLNDTPVFVSNISNDPITYLTTADLADDDGTLFFTQTVPPSLLRPGNNVLAVELHQQSPTSSDVSFDLELTGRPVPSLQLITLDSKPFLFWTAPGFHLEQTATLTLPWETSPASSPVAIEPLGQGQFYRLRADTSSAP